MRFQLGMRVVFRSLLAFSKCDILSLVQFMVQITVDLSEKGLEHVEEVITHVFQYIALLRQQPWPQWIFEGSRLL